MLFLFLIYKSHLLNLLSQLLMMDMLFEAPQWLILTTKLISVICRKKETGSDPSVSFLVFSMITLQQVVLKPGRPLHHYLKPL